MGREQARVLPQPPGTAPTVASHDQEPADPGVRENARLTAVTGVALLVPLLVVTGTGLVFGQLWRVHYFAGFLVLPLVLLKLASTGYRALRYYTGSSRYRQAGPPVPLLRLLAPVLIVATVVLFLSGVVMWFDHSKAGVWSTLHTDSAVVFSSVVAIHLLAYLPRAWRTARTARSERRITAAEHPERTASRRRGAVLGAVVFGVVLAVATVPGSQQPQRGPGRFHDHAGFFAPAPPATAPVAR